MMTSAYSIAPSLIVMAAVMGITTPAWGQADQPFTGSGPTFPSALSQSESGNEDVLILSPKLAVSYDSNVLRRANPTNQAVDNFRITPAATLKFSRLVGRTRFGASVLAGYDFNSRFSFLNRARIIVAGGASLPVGSQCPVSIRAEFQKYQYDLANSSNPGGATNQEQTYSVDLKCKRSAGIAPQIGVSYNKINNGGLPVLSDTDVISGHAGVQFSKPSLGKITLLGSLSEISRTDALIILGAEDRTRITEAKVIFDRAVAPRLHFSLAGGYVRARASLASVPDFSGVSYGGVVTWLPSPKFVVTLRTAREARNSGGIAASYVVSDQYNASITWKLSNASNLFIDATREKRDYRGTNPLFIGTVLNKDRTNSFGARYSYALSEKLNMALSVRNTKRNGDATRFNYSSTSISASIGARF